MKLAVIGRGLIGSAAARHLSGSGYDVTLVGPSEPSDYQTHAGVFASHYDEGRITRGLDPYPFWSKVSRASIARYREIEAQSGIGFYSEVGILMAGPKGSAPISSVVDVAKTAGIAFEQLDQAGLKLRFPYFAFEDDVLGVFEAVNAGHISPRRLVQAQTTCARQNGAVVVDAVVEGLSEGSDHVTLATSCGDMRFDRVLVATGGFSEALLGERSPLTPYARTVAMFRISEAEGHRLAGMPSHIALLPTGEDPYLLPPIRYPDGHLYLKLGGDPEDIALPTTGDVCEWFRSGGSEAVGERLEAQIRVKIPGLEILERVIKPCVTTYTPDNHPDIRALSGRVAIAAGGCGRAAKNSDELGRLGGEVLLGRAQSVRLLT